MNLEHIKKIYFIGIGGIGMSATAGIARAKGFDVSGSDADDIYEPAKGVLDRHKIPYSIGYKAENFSGADIVVSTSAVDQSNPEVAKAIEMNVPFVSFPQLLGALVDDKERIVIVGTHGKGTTSGLISFVLKELEDSGFFVGAVLNNLNTNFYYGKGKNFVIEGDEYKSSHTDANPKFMYYNPNILLINNLEFDHPDMYHSFEQMKDSFRKLLNQMPKDGTVVYNSDDNNVVDLVSNIGLKKIGFGFNSADIQGTKPELLENSMFEIKINNDSYQTPLPGLPYAYDLLAAVSVLQTLGYKHKDINEIIKKYTGVKRRYELIYDGNITIIDDYAHHPTAVKNTLEATRAKYPNRRIICFFEPHTYSRTKETLEELSKAFNSADLVYLAEVYPAREQKLPSSITGQQVVAEISKHHQQVKYVADKKDALTQLDGVIKDGDVVIVMAVGSFNTLVYDLKEKYANKG